MILLFDILLFFKILLLGVIYFLFSFERLFNKNKFGISFIFFLFLSYFYFFLILIYSYLLSFLISSNFLPFIFVFLNLNFKLFLFILKLLIILLFFELIAKKLVDSLTIYFYQIL